MTGSVVPRSLSRTVFRGVRVSGAGYLVTQALTLAVYLVLARLVTPGEFGTFAAGALYAGIGTLFAQSGMLSALIQRRDRLDEAANTALVATVGAGIAFSLLGLALSPLIGRFFGSHDVTLVAAAMSGFIALRQTTTVPNALLQRRFSFVRRVISEPAAVVAFGATAITGASYGLGVWALVAGTYAAVTTQVVASWALVRWRPRPGRASFALWRELVAYGKHITAADLVRRVTSESGALFTGRFLGIGPLGQYQLAYRIAARPFAALVNSVTFVLFPAFARIADDEVRFHRAFLRSLRWVSVVALPMSFILLPLGEPVALVLFGPRWRDAGLALMGMCAYTAGWAFVSLAEHVAKVVDRPDVVLRIDVCAGLSLVALVAALVHVSLVAVGIALSLSAIVAAAYSFAWLGRLTRTPLSRIGKEIWPPAVATTVMAGGLYALDRLVLEAGTRTTATGIALLGLELAIGAVLYVLCLAALVPEVAREVHHRFRRARFRQ
jgi:O-antigen/teichoic acid export membrane protein